MPNHLSVEELKFWESVYLETIRLVKTETPLAALNRYYSFPPVPPPPDPYLTAVDRCCEMADAAVEARRLRYARDGNS
jgi:hypothetical protein